MGLSLTLFFICSSFTSSRRVNLSLYVFVNGGFFSTIIMFFQCRCSFGHFVFLFSFLFILKKILYCPVLLLCSSLSVCVYVHGKQQSQKGESCQTLSAGLRFIMILISEPTLKDVNCSM